MRYNNQDTQSSLSQLRQQPTLAETLQNAQFKPDEMEDSEHSLSFSPRNKQAEESKEKDLIEHGYAACGDFNADVKKISIAKNLKK